MLDVAVIGAGAAGLAAARTAHEAGLEVTVLEAKGRTGGRGLTRHEPLGVPFDRGCTWLHSASVNPFTALADRLGFAYRRQSRTRRIHMGTRWASDAERAEWLAYEQRNAAAILAAGRAGRDIAVAEVIERDSRWSPLYAFWVAITSGIAPEAGSTLDFANYEDTDENWPVRDGFGALIARVGDGLPVSLNTPVTRIDRGGRGVRLTTPRGTLSARAAIVTVSTAVLASGRIVFDPPLPDWKQDAIAGLPLGMANKIAFAFDSNALGVPANSSAHMLAETPETIGFQLRPFGRNIAVGHVGGPFASALERAGEAAMIDYGLERLAAMFGSDIRRHVVASTATAWETDRDIGGGYSAALPGHGHRRAALAAPLDDRLFFAGEAASTRFYSTAHGAYLTGVEAARKAAEGVLSRCGTA